MMNEQQKFIDMTLEGIKGIAASIPRQLEEMYAKMSPEHAKEFLKQLEDKEVHKKVKTLAELLAHVDKQRK